MDKKIKILIGILVAIAVIGSGWLAWKWQDYFGKGVQISVVTDKSEYEKEGNLKLNIRNNSRENICFSSCYPYFLEKKETQWESYVYGICRQENVNDICIEPGQVKAFEMKLALANEGLHRLALPVCAGCKEGETFKESQRFYSNQFKIQ